MKINARIKEILPVQTGTGQNGEWTKLSFIVTTIFSTLPVNICITSWGDRIKQDQIVVGNTVEIEIEIKSREFNGRWYTDIIGQEMKTIREAKDDDVFGSIPSAENKKSEDKNEPDTPF